MHVMLAFHNTEQIMWCKDIMNSPIPAFSHHIIKHSKPSCAYPGMLLYLHTWVLCYLYFHETQSPIHKPNVFVPLSIPLDNLVSPGSTYLLQDPFSFQDTHANKIYFLTFFSTHLKTGDFFFKLSYTFFSAILPSSPRILPRPVTPHSQFPQIFSLPSWLRSCVVSILISLKQVTFCLLKWISASYLDSSLEIYSSSTAHLL